MSVIISGSLAYDTVCFFKGRFGEMLIPGEPSHLNITFLAGRLERHFGGCAGNIAWSSRLLGGSPRILAQLGRDGGEYRRRFEEAGISLELVPTLPGFWTAQAFITVDSAGNQLTTFHEGAMAAPRTLGSREAAGVTLAHIAPGGVAAMSDQGRFFSSNGIPYVFDPGQTTSQISPDELRRLAKGARLLCVSEYEEKLLEERTGLTRRELASGRRVLLVTYGSAGSVFYLPDGSEVEVAAVPASSVADPVGAGDAYRGGLLRGLEAGLGWKECGQLGATMSSFKIEHGGGQGYSPSIGEIAERYEDAWRESLPLPVNGREKLPEKS